MACVVALFALTPAASSIPANDGVGRFGGAIDWVEWGTKGEVLNLSAPITKTSTTNFAGHQLNVSCTISNFVRTGSPLLPVLTAYASGGWSGDALDDLYYNGTTGTGNTLVNGLRTASMEASFDFSCSATLDGSPYPLEGIVFADAEQSGAGEHVTGEISNSATWRLIDRYRNTLCGNDSQVTRTVGASTQTLRLDNPPSALCSPGPAAVAFADGATSGRITVSGGGASAVALGAVVTFDHGDAPASYGDALHSLQYPFSGGEPPTGTSALFAGNSLAATTQPTLRLGASVDPEGTVFSANANDDDTSASGAFGAGDDETQGPLGAVSTDRGNTFTRPVQCSGSGVLAGWVDWNGNGAFDAGERAGDVTCSGGTASLNWTVPADAIAQTRTFMRLRYAAAAAEIADPAGLATSGEVEDHSFQLNMPPDLTVIKSASPAVVEPGGLVTWSITLRNLGPGPSSAAIVEDTIPAGITNFSAPGCTVVGSTASCVFGPLAIGGEATITLTGNAPSATSTCFTNTATMTQALPADPYTSNNIAEATSCTRPPRADVRITKSASPTTVAQGNDVRYTLNVSNAGPDPAENVEVSDLPAAGVSPQTATPSQGSCPSASACSLGTLPANGTATIEIVARADELGTHGNTASVSTTTLDTDPLNDTDSATIVVQPQADLSVVKTASDSTLVEGQDFSYTLTVRNAGPSTAVDAVLTDSIPTGVSVRGVDSSRGSCTQSDPVVCQLGDMGKDATATITIRVTADREGSPVNTAILSSPTPDPDHLNNQDSTQLTTVRRADLSIDKSVSAETVLVGESFTYTLRVRNDGPNSAVNAVVTDRIPDGLRLDEATSSKGSCAGAPTVVCELGTLPRDGSETIRLTVTALKAGVFDNTGTVTSETPDLTPDNNIDDAHVEAGTRADVSIDKSVNVETVVAGDKVVYGLVVRNNGPHGAANVTVTDPVPAGMTAVSAEPSSGSCSLGAVVICELGDLAPGESATIRLETRADVAGRTRNVAMVTTSTPDSDPTNNQDETQVTSEKADLSIVKSAPRKPAELGARVTYKLTVRNAGPSGARRVVVTDPIPEGLRVLDTKASAGSCSMRQGALVCELGDLAAGASATITVTARAVRHGKVTNVASVTSEFPSDPDLTNNTGKTTVRVKQGPANVTLSKHASRQRAAEGDRVSYRIVVRNEGARSAHDVRVCDRLPSGLAFVKHSGARLRDGAACWSIATLAPHTVRRFSVTVRVLGGGARRLVNVATVNGDNAEERAQAGVRRAQEDGRVGGVTG